MSFTKEHVNDFFQVKKKLDLDDTNQLEIPKINIQDVKVLETIPEVLENQDESLGNSPTKLKLDKKAHKDSDNEEEDVSEETGENKENPLNFIHDELDTLDTLDTEDNENIDVTDQDIDKISSRQKRKEKQIKLLIQIFKLLSFHVDTLEDLTNLTFPRETLLQKDNQKKLLNLIPQLKLVYNSSYLNCLHDNSIFKQKFPGVNLVRQVLKCHHLALTPKIISNGYEKATGKKKVSRIFKIEKKMF